MLGERKTKSLSVNSSNCGNLLLRKYSTKAYFFVTMAPRRAKKPSTTAIDENNAVATTEEITEQANSKTTKVDGKKTKADTKKIKTAKDFKEEKLNNVAEDEEILPAKAESKPIKATSMKNAKVTVQNDKNDVDASVVKAEAKPKRAAATAATKNMKAIEVEEKMNVAAENSKKSRARGKKKKQEESPKAIVSKDRSKKAASKKVDEKQETSPSRPEKKSTEAKPTKKSTNAKTEDLDQEEVVDKVSETKGKRGAKKATPQQEVPEMAKAKKGAESTAKSTKSIKSTEKSTQSNEQPEQTTVNEMVQEHNEANSAKGRKRKPTAKVEANKVSAKKVKNNDTDTDTVDGLGGSKANGTKKKHKPDTKAAADSTTSDVEADDGLVTKRKKPLKAASKETKPKMNATTNDLSKINFETDKEFTLKIVSWNVAGLRALVTKGGFEYFEYEKPDIICLQVSDC